MRRRVTGIGETILDIIFKGGRPVAAVPGGSSFNSIVSVGRAGVPCQFVGYTGADEVGAQTVRFMKENNVGTEYFDVRADEKSAVSLAFLYENADAHYVFYKQPPRADGERPLPALRRDDVLFFGSYYASCPGTRPLITRMLREAAENGAIVYYDLNFRRSHRHELEALTPAILSNFGASTVVRGSADDFEVMYGTRDAQEIYDRHIRAYCPTFICTAADKAATVCTPHGTLHFPIPPVDDIVSTVGAGDNFNAGFACALVWNGITRESLPALSDSDWQTVMATATAFAAEACRSTDNYISPDFGKKMAAQAAK